MVKKQLFGKVFTAMKIIVLKITQYSLKYQLKATANLKFQLFYPKPRPTEAKAAALIRIRSPPAPTAAC